MKRGHDRHFEARQQLDDISAGLTAENSVFVLEGNNVEFPIVEKLGCLAVVADRLVVNLETHSPGIVVGAARIRHGDDAGLEIRASCGDSPMKIMGKGGDSATAREVIADEGHTLERFHLVVS